MGRVVIFSTASCPYCVTAKQILVDNGIAFMEVNLHERPSLWKEMRDRTGGKSSVPQIFFHSDYIGWIQILP